MKRIYIENAYFVLTVFNFRKNKCCQLSFTHIAFLHGDSSLIIKLNITLFLKGLFKFFK